MGVRRAYLTQCLINRRYRRSGSAQKDLSGNATYRELMISWPVQGTLLGKFISLAPGTCPASRESLSSSGRTAGYVPPPTRRGAYPSRVPPRSETLHFAMSPKERNCRTAHLPAASAPLLLVQN